MNTLLKLLIIGVFHSVCADNIVEEFLELHNSCQVQGRHPDMNLIIRETIAQVQGLRSKFLLRIKNPMVRQLVEQSQGPVSLGRLLTATRPIPRTPKMQRLLIGKYLRLTWHLMVVEQNEAHFSGERGGQILRLGSQHHEMATLRRGNLKTLTCALKSVAASDTHDVISYVGRYSAPTSHFEADAIAVSIFGGFCDLLECIME
ncbi:hypothetical protein CAPTEDRAFT_195851 [Capitella teleta]|uniref:Uncharacterized protein n=1 Tax=Capitella teleta TaxID=283909 RepID=R7UCJ7_CAPTE|nr:hypothetical protein CAPTEDRAFT_195851 [Capitella teleta]|eukprot:ELU03724.1 hypothetical protein CAPTEDRAFT_195851 [Capitella teleta]